MELVAEWRRRGKSASAFAEDRGVPSTALRYWINRPATRSARPKVAAAKVVAARPSASARLAQPTTTLARVVRPGEAGLAVAGGSEVRVLVGTVANIVEPGFDEGHLRPVIRAVGELG